MREGWESTTLGDVAVFVMGQAPAGSDCNKRGVGTPFVKAGEFGDRRPIIREWTTDPKKFAKEGDVLICVVGATCGKINLGANCAIGRSAAAIRPHPNALDQFFLHYYLEGQVEKFRAGSTGAAQTVISREMLSAMSLPLPPLEEQQQIVAILDGAFEGLARARANAEANLRNARELFENFIGAMFTRHASRWPTAPLQQLVEHDCTLSYGIVQPGDESAKGLPIVRPTDLGQPTITLRGLKRIEPSRADGYVRTKLKGTEILLCVRGSTGVVSMASPDLEGANVTRGIVPVRFQKEMVDQRLGYFQFLSKPIQDQIRAKTYGAALMQINIGDLREITFVVPPPDQQKDLVERLESVANDFGLLVLNYEKKISEFDNLRQSVLQKAFAGELT